jgi:hypothetical protein
MNVTPSRLFRALLASLLLIGAARTAHGTTYAGSNNEGPGFGGDLGQGSLNVTNDGSGGMDFVFTLNGTNNLDNTNSIVIYIDNSTGNGIGASTSGLDDTSNGATEAISEYSGPSNQSILKFGGLMNPQYGISLSDNNAIDYKLVNAGSLTFVDNANNGQTSGNGESYTRSGNVWSVDLPAVDFGLSSFSGDTIKFVAIEISQTGYSSSEATATLTGTQGWGSSQTLSTVDTFALIPEPASGAALACGAGLLLLLRRRGRRPL